MKKKASFLLILFYLCLFIIITNLSVMLFYRWIIVLALSLASSARDVTLSNVRLPVDSDGNLMLTGEMSVVRHNSTWYVYVNNWGGCKGIDCCPSAQGCASCCMQSEGDGCVYTNNHSVVVYATKDLIQWNYLGVALPRSSRINGIVFRPCVVFNEKTHRFVMWYEDRHAGQLGYAVAISATPQGPFTTISNSTKMHGKGRPDGSGDFNILVDDDGEAYHVRDGFVIEKLNEDYTAGSGTIGYLDTPKPSEGPVFFKRNGTYYILPGTSCCGCKGGSSIYVFTSTNPLGPYDFRGEIGSNASQSFDLHSPYNYITRAQASTIIKIPDIQGAEQVLWIGNQWVTSQEPGQPRNHDLLYFENLKFYPNGSIAQVVRRDETVVHIPDNGDTAPKGKQKATCSIFS